METKLYSVSLRMCTDEESKISVVVRARGWTYEGCCDQVGSIVDAIISSTDYEVAVSSRVIKVEPNEKGSTVSAVWLGDVNMVPFVVGIEGVVGDEPWRVDGGCRYIGL